MIKKAIKDAKDETYNEINSLKEEIANLRNELKNTEDQQMDYKNNCDILKRLYENGVIDIDGNLT